MLERFTPTRTHLTKGSNAQALHRHDLVWLDPVLALSDISIATPHHALVQHWRDRNLPFIVARQQPDAPHLRLGFTQPGTGSRQRVAIHVDPGAIVETSPPPTLNEMLAYVPDHWQNKLAKLASAMHQLGLVPGVYGSLVTEALSGDSCLRPNSDIDIIIDCNSRSEAISALALLQSHEDELPRLDGELRMQHGWAVAWRELAHAIAIDATDILAKSDNDVRMIDLDALFSLSSDKLR